MSQFQTRMLASSLDGRFDGRFDGKSSNATERLETCQDDQTILFIRLIDRTL